VKAVQISAGKHYSIALLSDGTVVGWGDNEDGKRDAPEGLTNVTQIDAGGNLSSAVRSDCSVEFWGNTRGLNLSIPSSLGSLKAVRVGTSSFVAYSSNGNVFSAIGRSNSLFSFDGSSSTIGADIGKDFIALAYNDGNFQVKNDYGGTMNGSGYSNILDVAAGETHYLFLQSSGLVNGAHNDNENDYYAYMTIPAEARVGVKAISAGNRYSLTLRGDGRVFAFGDTDVAELLSNKPDTQSSDAVKASAISAGYDHALALMSDGSVVAWGKEAYGQLDVPGSAELNGLQLRDAEGRPLPLVFDAAKQAYSVRVDEDVTAVEAEGSAVTPAYTGVYVNDTRQTATGGVAVPLTGANTTISVKAIPYLKTEEKEYAIHVVYQPAASFGEDGNEIWASTVSSEVDLANTTGQAEYIWSTDTTEPVASADWQPFDSGDSLSLTGVDGDWYLHVRAEDDNGEPYYARSSRFRLDNAAPVLDVAMSAGSDVYPDASWTNRPVTVSASVYDGGSGVRSLSYSADSGLSWLPYSQPLTLEENGVHRIRFKAADFAGNEATASRTANISGDGRLTLNAVLESNGMPYASGEWTRFGVTASAMAASEDGAPASAFYSLDEGANWAPLATEPVSFLADGTHPLWFKASDDAGNELIDKLAIRIDTAPPTVAFDPNGNPTVSSSASVRVDVSDALSGPSAGALEYVWTTNADDPGAAADWIPFGSGSRIVKNDGSGDWYLHVRIADAAGNTTSETAGPFALKAPSGGSSSTGGAALSANAELSGLEVSAGQLAPAFSPSITQYELSVGAEVAELTLKPTSGDSRARIRINGMEAVSGKGSGKIRLQPGDNKLEVVLTAENGEEMTYTIVVHRAKDNKPSEPPVCVSGTAGFADLKGHWAEKAVRQAACDGNATGYSDGAFRPNAPITRAEFVVLAMRMLGYPKGTSPDLSFEDREQIGDWAAADIARAAAAGFVGGLPDGTFRPNAPIGRAEIAAIAARALGLPTSPVGKTGFADDESIPAWAKGAAEALRTNGLLLGRGDGSFGPGTATRAEALVLLQRVVAAMRA